MSGPRYIAQLNTATDYFPSTSSGRSLTDALGSVRQLTNASGAVTYASAYDPYGMTAQAFGASQTSYGFTGEDTDPRGMVFLRARYYLPGDGRFLTRDTWMGDYQNPLTLNAWNYTSSNPVNYTDPSGYSPNCAIKGTCGPDVTEWFMYEMGKHYEYGLEIRNKVNRIKAIAYTKLNDPCKDPITFLSEVALEEPFVQILQKFKVRNIPIRITPILTPKMADFVVESLAYLEFGLYGLAVDYSNVTYRTNDTSCNTGQCASAVETNIRGNRSDHQVVSLCGRCTDASDLGNMMFGLGGAARGYSMGLTYISATGFNAANDNPKNISELRQVTIFSPDPWGTVPGWYIGRGQLFRYPTLFCLAASFPLARDNYTQINGCVACKSKYDGIHKRPSSLHVVGDRGYPYGAQDTIE